MQNQFPLVANEGEEEFNLPFMIDCIECIKSSVLAGVVFLCTFVNCHIYIFSDVIKLSFIKIHSRTG